MTYRIERFNSHLRHEISDLIQFHIKDPRLGTVVSVTSVEVTPDLRHARVRISRMGTDEEKRQTIEALVSAAGYIRHQLGDRMKSRHIPELTFKLDETIEKADRVLRMIDRISEESTQ